MIAVPFRSAALTFFACLGGGLLGCAATETLPAAAPQGSTVSVLAPAAIDSEQPAEHLSAELHVLGVPVGSLHTSICTGQQPAQVHVRTEVKPAALVDALHPVEGSADALLSADSGAPVHSYYRFVEGDVERNYRIQYLPEGYTYRYDNGGKAYRSGRIALHKEGPPHDLQSALMALRAWRPRLAERRVMQVVLGRRLWRVEVTARGPDMVTVHGRPQLAIKIEGHATRLWNPKGQPPRKRDFVLWLEKSASRVPLRVEAHMALGKVSLQLTQRTTAPSCASSAQGRVAIADVSETATR